MKHVFTDEIKKKLNDPRALKALEEWFEYGGTLKNPVIVSFVHNENFKWDILFGSEGDDDWILWGINESHEFNSIRLSELEEYRMIINHDPSRIWTVST